MFDIAFDIAAQCLEPLGKAFEGNVVLWLHGATDGSNRFALT
jgi:hypothetical protein